MNLLRQNDLSKQQIVESGCYFMVDLAIPQIFYQKMLSWQQIMALYDMAVSNKTINTNCFINDHTALIEMAIRMLGGNGQAKCSDFHEYPRALGMVMTTYPFHVLCGKPVKGETHFRLWVPSINMYYDPHLPILDLEYEIGVRFFAII